MKKSTRPFPVYRGIKDRIETSPLTPTGFYRGERKIVALSNLDKIWFPQSKITKGDILDYYSQAAHYIIPHVKNHLLTMQRFPGGINEESFYQKNAGSYFPSWIKTVPVAKHEGGNVDYVVCNNAATLIYLANQGALTLHAWLSQASKLYYPDRMIFDLDPSVNDFSRVRKAALLIKAMFDELNIPNFAMTTGSRGMHVYIPLKRVHTFDEIGDFAHAVGKRMIQEAPKEFTLEVRKNKRGSKIFIDTLRNRYSATSVAPYSVRPYEKAPVAAPLHWEEVNDSKLTSQKFTINNVLARLKSEGDPWQGIDDQAVSLKKNYKRVLS
jgi:bifunctional non-homologous end joining protein LigD